MKPIFYEFMNSQSIIAIKQSYFPTHLPIFYLSKFNINSNSLINFNYFILIFFLVGLQVLWDSRELKQKRKNLISSQLQQIDDEINDQNIFDIEESFNMSDLSEVKNIKKAISRQNQAQKDGDSFLSLNKLESQSIKLLKKNFVQQNTGENQTISKIYNYEESYISKSRSPQRSPVNSQFDGLKKNEQSKFFVTDYFFKLPIIRSRSTENVIPNNNNASYLLEKTRNLKQRCMNFNPYDDQVKIKNKNGVTKINLRMLKQKIIKHSEQEIKIIEDQNRELIKNYNNLFHENVKLARKIKNQQISNRNISAREENQEKINILRQIQEMERQEEELKQKYLKISQNKERFVKILKLCLNNMDQNKQWITQLNFLHNNFKKMILWEKQDLYKLKKELKDILKLGHDYIDAFIDQIQYSNVNMNIIQKEIYVKKRFDEYFQNTDYKIEESLQQLNNSLPILQQESLNKTLDHKYTKSSKSFQSNMAHEDIIQLQQLLNIDNLHDPEILHNNDIYQQFVLKQIRNQDLREDIIVQHRLKIENFQQIKILKDKIQDLKHYEQEEKFNQNFYHQQSQLKNILNNIRSLDKNSLELEEIQLNRNYSSLSFQNQKFIDNLMPTKVMIENLTKSLNIDFQNQQLNKKNLTTVLHLLIQKISSVKMKHSNEKILPRIQEEQSSKSNQQIFIQDQTNQNMQTQKLLLEINNKDDINQTLDLDQTQILENVDINYQKLDDIQYHNDIQQQQQQSSINN